MPLIKSGAQAILDSINASASIGLTVKDVEFGVPSVVAEPVDGKNTKVKVMMGQSAPARGAVVVTYHRLDFAEQFSDHDGANPMVITITDTYNTSLDCVAAMRQYLGMDIDETDLDMTQIDLNDLTVLIKASSTSLGWTGEITAKLIKGDAIISGVFPAPALTGTFLYPNLNTNLGQAAVYSYRYDYSDYGATLKTVTAETLNLTTIAAMMKAVTGQDWVVARNPSDYNLKESEFLYNGLNSNAQYPGNPNYSRILVLNLAFYSLKLGGFLYIHYNA